MLFSRTGDGLCIYHLFVWSNLNFLHIPQWITSSCLVLYFFCAKLAVLAYYLIDCFISVIIGIIANFVFQRTFSVAMLNIKFA